MTDITARPDLGEERAISEQIRDLLLSDPVCKGRVELPTVRAIIALATRPHDAALAGKLAEALGRTVILFQHALETPAYGNDDPSREELSTVFHDARAALAEYRKAHP